MIDKKKLFEISLKVRDYLIKEGYNDYIFKKGRILFNKVPSPDGAKGMFLLLEKSEFNLNGLNEIQKQISDILTFQTTLSEIKSKTKDNRLQDQFEEYTEKILNQVFPGQVKRADVLRMNEYDFEIKSVKIEVKSDKWKYTGNVSLELLREYADSHPENVGSIIKTKCTFWQIYYYHLQDGTVSSEIYLTSQLQDKTSEFLVSLNEKLGLGVAIE